MTLDQLRYFYEAARFQHVGKAAKFVHISPSAISAALAALELELDCKLFDRIGKAIVLNDRGRRLKDEAEKLFEHINSLKEKIGDRPGLLRGSYRLGGSHFLASHFLASTWSTLQNRNPELDGDIGSFSTSRALQELTSGALDMALCFSPYRYPTLKQFELYRGKLVIAVRPRHPLLKLTGRKAVFGLSDYPAVIHKAQPGTDLCEAHPIFSRYQITPHIRFSFENDACAVQRVVSSQSWAMLPDLVAQQFSREVKMINLPPDWDATYFVALVFRGDREKNPVFQALLQELEERFCLIRM